MCQLTIDYVKISREQKVNMKTLAIAMLFCQSVTVFTSTCETNPSLLQCIAATNRFLIPRSSSCDPFSNGCRMGDLIDVNIATCALQHVSNVRHSLMRGFQVSHTIRCIPELSSKQGIDSRLVAVDTGDPRCMPVPMKGARQFTCGEKGTRCVCDAPDGVRNLLKSKCKCQYFVDYCAVPDVCRHQEAECSATNTEVSCSCPPQHKTCTAGINQCSTNPTLCTDRNAECVELYDELSSWEVKGNKNDDGYACLYLEDMKFLKRSTNYCGVRGSVTSTGDINVLNYVDACCLRQLRCGSTDRNLYGHIMSHRPCYCNTEFRKCLNRYRKVAVYRDLADAALNALNQLKSCKINDGTKCDPRYPVSCTKGDLIDPRVAHCRINCKTGPLLPIGQRMCSIRQCIPPNYVEGVRVIDVPHRDSSSLCEPERKLPFLCGKGDTRCVCDGKPAVNSFSDRCRCQFWPLEL